MEYISRLYKAILHCFLICVCNHLQAQNIVVKHYGVNDGLPSSECYWVMQDSRQFLWVATDAGVVKYDGYKFVTYNSSKGLPDNTVFKIHEDAYGRIWFSTFSGKLAYYSYETDSIYSIPANKELSNVVKYLPDDFCFDDKDTLWVSLQLQGFIKVVPPLYEKFIRYQLPQQGYFIKEFPNNKFLYGVDSKENYTDTPLLFYFIGSDNKYKEATPGYRIIPKVTLLSTIKTAPHNYLFSNDYHVFKVSDHSIEEVIHHDSPIISMYKDTKGRTWVNTRGDGTLLFSNDKLDQQDAHFFANTIVSSMTEDIDNGYWFTTTTNGIYYIPSLNFKYFNKDCGLTSDKIYDMSILMDKLYCITSDSKLNILDLATNTFTSPEKGLYSYTFSFDNKLLFNEKSDNEIVFTGSRIEDQDKNLIIPLKNAAGQRNLALKKVIEYDADFLIGYDQTLNLYKVNKNTGMAFPLIKIPSRIFSIYKDKSDIFIGTKEGLYEFENNKLIFLGDSIPLLTNRIEAITGVNNTLFIATKGVGVLCYKNNKIISCFNESNGLASNICKCIIKDAENNIWVGTNRGISRLSADKKGIYSCTSLNLSNGLVSNEVNQIIEYKNQLYFATNNGIGIFNINDAFKKTKFIPVYIERFRVNTINHDYRSLQDLAYDENFIEINYKGIYLKNEGDLNYKYRLEGLDTNWTITKNTNIQYTTLPSGQYKFIVYAIDSNRNVISKPAIIFFNIQIPFWRAWWFYALIFIFISVMTSFLYKRRINTIQKTEAQKSISNIKIAQSELKALRSQMNPHFIFNALNSIQNFIIKNESADAQKYLTKFSRLIRFVLENSKNETILLSKEIETLTLYLELEALRASFSFDYEIKISAHLNPHTIYIPAMLIQPYIENAILHGVLALTERKGKITITFDVKESILICQIDDNGIGRLKARGIKQKKERSHLSMGMSVTKERIENLNKYTSTFTSVDIIDKHNNDQPSGTLVIIKIKYNTL